VIRTPDGHSLVYDAGDRGGQCIGAVHQIIPESGIDLLVLSHSDADHITDVPDILHDRPAAAIIHALDDHNVTATLRDERAAILSAETSGARVWDLVATPLPASDPGDTRVFRIGYGGVATVIAGWGDGDLTRGPGEPPLPTPEHRNALSTVIRFEYGGHSILLTGDTVGRLREDPNSTCAYAERIMVGDASTWPIDSDVLVGQHHGGNNASSNCFIRAVSPTWVVFSAGHKGYHHPTQAAADRFVANGVDKDRMLRTDRGDDEGSGEWQYGDIQGCIDQPGDDDVEIFMPDDGSDLRVAYRERARTCPVHTRAFYQPARRRR
jgi:beta-lactamase superfamily II metal-dependent hydrolase